MTDEAQERAANFFERVAYVLAFHEDDIPTVEGMFGPTADWAWVFDRVRDESYWRQQ